MRLARAGETGLVSRRLAGRYEPVDLHAALAASGGAPFLFRRTGGCALILVDSALRLEARGLEATIAARSESGSLLLDRLEAALGGRRAPLELSLRFERSEDPDESLRAASPSPLDALRQLALGQTPLDQDEPFAIVAAGIVGFDHVDMVETLAERPPGDFPDLLFDLAETLVVVEPSGAARVLALSVGSDDPGIAHRQHHLAAERLAHLVERCRTATPCVPPPPPVSVQATPDLDDGQFESAVEQIKQGILAGEIFQAVPSRMFRAPCADPIAAFRRLVAADPSAYQFAYDTGYGQLIGASPETALELRREGGGLTVAVSPIAGTRPRGASPDEDDRQEADLRLDSKEVAEHLMLVDLARNDIARVCESGTRKVSKLLGVERFARVMHLVSTVEGRLAQGRDAIDAIRACLNVGTLSGAPKLRAIELIRSVEPSARGPYGGAIGWIAGDGSVDTAVVIRSALVRGGVAEVRAGAGVVQDSDPRAEAAETRAKASAVLAAIGAAA